MKIICFLLFVLFTTTYAQNNRCPFDHLYHLGDGVFDNGNSIANKYIGSRLPAARRPYGASNPLGPTGRWSDGLLDIDFGARGLGFPQITPYLSENSTSANAIIFAVARSTILDRSFFRARGVRIPSFAASLSVQMSWFRNYINTVTSTPQGRAEQLANSLFLFGDVEANDITIPLTQGKSIHEVRNYISYVIQAQINAAREVIRMGATRVILPGNAPMGCYPFIQTKLATNNPEDYDDIGCLKAVNDLMIIKNFELQSAISNLRQEFPNVFIMYADFYTNEEILIREMTRTRGNSTLQACCGTGGKYNYDSKRFCGSNGVPVCSDPENYFFWDGIHLTQGTNNRLSSALAAATLVTLNCTVSS